MNVDVSKLNKSKVVKSNLKGIIVDVKSDFGKNIFVDKSGEIKTKYPDDIFLKLFIDVELPNGKVAEVKEVIRFYENPTDYSVLGKYLLKYNSVEVGTIVDITKNDNGFFKVDLS